MLSEFFTLFNAEGLIIGIFTFLIIGLYHPLVIKGEYYFGRKIKWWFLIAGIIFLIASLLSHTTLISTVFGVASFSSFWSIKEVDEQVERVRKGWFPSNPDRKKVRERSRPLPYFFSVFVSISFVLRESYDNPDYSIQVQSP